MVSNKTVPEELNLNFRSKFNHGFSNHGCLHWSMLKACYGFKEKRAHKGKRFPFKIFKMRFMRSWECFKTIWNSPKKPVELTQKLAGEKKTPHSSYSYVVTIVGHYYAVMIARL